MAKAKNSPLVTKPTLTYKGNDKQGKPLARFNSAERTGPKDGVKFGKRTGLSMTAYVDELLRANEKPGNQRSDAELQAELNAEFSGRPACQAISAYRGYFNRSLHGHNPDGKGKSTSHGRNMGEGKVEAKHDPNHFNTGRVHGEAAKGKAKGKAVKGKAVKGAKKAPRKAAKKAPRKAVAKA
jgi:hypothetical protein